jgi:Fe-S cluster biogenesis protein NfuA
MLGFRGRSTMPAKSAISVSAIHDRVADALEQIRPAIQSDGGDVQLVEITPAGVVRIRLLGACIGCPSATMTLRTGIERSLIDNIPGVTGVEAVA